MARTRMNKPIDLSVIVPAFNEEKLITHSLRAIKTALGEFTRRGWETQLVVCDNNSTDRTSELARAEGAVVVFEPVNQIARARNRGATVARVPMWSARSGGGERLRTIE